MTAEEAAAAKAARAAADAPAGVLVHTLVHRLVVAAPVEIFDLILTAAEGGIGADIDVAQLAVAQPEQLPFAEGGHEIINIYQCW